jgi:hypothetical protein
MNILKSALLAALQVVGSRDGSDQPRGWRVRAKKIPCFAFGMPLCVCRFRPPFRGVASGERTDHQLQITQDKARVP